MAERLKYSAAVGPELPDAYPAIFKKDMRRNLEDAARCGFRFVELHVRSPELVDAGQLLKSCRDNGLRFTTISTGMGHAAEGLSLIDDDPEVRRRARERLEGMIELAATLGCSIIVGLLRGKIFDFSRYRELVDRLTNGLEQLLRGADRLGVNMDIEAISHAHCNYLKTADETLAYVNGIGHPRLRVLLDTYHLHLEDRNIAQRVIECGMRLGYVHYSDSNRRRPGSGNVDFVAMGRTLRSMGYEGFVGLEYVPSPDLLDEAKRTLEYLEAIERMLDNEE